MSQDGKKLHKHELNSVEESSEDDEDAELLTEAFEEKFFKLLSQLKKKDKILYDEKVNFFPVKIAENDTQTCDHRNKNKEGEKSKMNYKTWLKGQKDRVEDEIIKGDLEALHEFWADPKLNKSEKFLRDYILNKKFLDPDDLFNVEEEIERLSEEEKEIEKEIEFEHKYNYRFEKENEDLEEQSTNIKGKQGKPSKDKHNKIGALNTMENSKKPRLKSNEKFCDKSEGTNLVIKNFVKSPENKVQDYPGVKENQVMKEESNISGMKKIDESFVKVEQQIGVLEVKKKRVVTENDVVAGGERRNIHSNNGSTKNNSKKSGGFNTSLKEKKCNDAVVELKDKRGMNEQTHTIFKKIKHRKRKHLGEGGGLTNEKKIKINSITTGAEEMQVKMQAESKTDAGFNITKAKCIRDNDLTGIKKIKQMLKQTTTNSKLTQEKNQIKKAKFNKKRKKDLKTTKSKINDDPLIMKGFQKESLCITVGETPDLESRKEAKWTGTLNKKHQIHDPEELNMSSKKKRKQRWSYQERKKGKQLKPLHNKQLPTIQGKVKKRKERHRRLLKMQKI